MLSKALKEHPRNWGLLSSHFYPFYLVEFLAMSICSLSLKKVTLSYILTTEASPPSGHPGCP